MTSTAPVLSVVATAYNEEAVIDTFLETVFTTLKDFSDPYEVVIIDDGSSDKTEIKLMNAGKIYPQLRVIRLSRNFGHEAAITAGLQTAKGEYVIIMDADMQDPPNMIPLLYHEVLRGYDVVLATRKSRDGESYLKKKTSHLFYKLARRMTGLDIPENTGDFRIMNRRVVDAINQVKESNRFLKMIYSYVGYKTGTIFFNRDKRFAGKSKYNYAKLIGVAFDAILGFSTRPLRFVSLTSIFISFFSFFIAAFFFLKKIIVGDAVEGWTSLMVFASFMFALLFMFLGILSEYIGRILIESKSRPIYYIQYDRTNTEN